MKIQEPSKFFQSSIQVINCFTFEFSNDEKSKEIALKWLETKLKLYTNHNYEVYTNSSKVLSKFSSVLVWDLSKYKILSRPRIALSQRYIQSQDLNPLRTRFIQVFLINYDWLKTNLSIFVHSSIFNLSQDSLLVYQVLAIN